MRVESVSHRRRRRRRHRRRVPESQCTPRRPVSPASLRARVASSFPSSKSEVGIFNSISFRFVVINQRVDRSFVDRRERCVRATRRHRCARPSGRARLFVVVPRRLRRRFEEVSKRRRRFARHRRTTLRTPVRAAGRRTGREKARGISNKRASPGGRRLGGTTTTGRMGARDDSLTEFARGLVADLAKPRAAPAPAV